MKNLSVSLFMLASCSASENKYLSLLLPKPNCNDKLATTRASTELPAAHGVQGAALAVIAILANQVAIGTTSLSIEAV